jgi:DNA-binding response OmpR family regulator
MLAAQPDDDDHHLRRAAAPVVLVTLGATRADEILQAMPIAVRILVVDDEASSQAIIRQALEKDGFQLTAAYSAEEAFEELGRVSFDLVLCDAMLPGVDGFEVCRRIKASDSWRYTPTMLITALDGTDDMVRAVEAGADDFLQKPVERVVLRARVRALLRIRTLYRLLSSAPGQEAARSAETHRRKIIEASGLTPREREVLDLLLLGRTLGDTAEALGIAPRTVKYHQNKVLEKLGADSRIDLTRIFL